MFFSPEKLRFLKHSTVLVGIIPKCLSTSRLKVQNNNNKKYYMLTLLSLVLESITDKLQQQQQHEYASLNYVQISECDHWC